MRPIGLIADAFKKLGSSAFLGVRRLFTGGPSSFSPEVEQAWLKEELRVYATPQPWASPSSADDGGLTAGETWEMRLAYRDMVFREPAVKSALLTKCLAVAQLKPVMNPANKKRPRDREAARWVDYAVSRSVGGWPGLIESILLPGLFDGFSLCEKVPDKLPASHPDYPMFWTLRQAKSKETRSIRFRLDEYRNIMAVQNMQGAQGGQPVHPSEFLIFTHLKVFENPFGISDLRAAYRAANLIEAAIKLRAILLENFSGPFLVAKAADPTVRNKLRQLLGLARARGWITIPDNAELEVVNLATSAPDQFQQTIKDLREEIVTAIQGAYLQLLEGGVANGRGDTEVHANIAQLFQWWLATCVSQVINHQLIPDLVFPNYGGDVGLPTCQLGGRDKKGLKEAIDRFIAMKKELGLALSKEQIYDELMCEVPEDAADTLEADTPDKLAPNASANGGAPILGATFRDGPTNPALLRLLGQPPAASGPGI